MVCFVCVCVCVCVCVSVVPIVSCPQVPPSSEEVGHCDLVEVQEIGDTNVVVFRQGGSTVTPPIVPTL